MWRDDKPNAVIPIIHVVSFAFAAMGLGALPIGNQDPIYEVPGETVGIHWFVLIFCIAIHVITAYGSTMRRRDVLLIAQIYTSIATALLVACSHIIITRTARCRSCPVTVYLPSQGLYKQQPCPPFESSCRKSAGTFMFGALFMILCQLASIITIADRRETMRGEAPVRASSAGWNTMNVKTPL
eukprot:tig00000237_g20496.t1